VINAVPQLNSTVDVAPDPKSGASANSATLASRKLRHFMYGVRSPLQTRIHKARLYAIAHMPFDSTISAALNPCTKAAAASVLSSKCCSNSGGRSTGELGVQSSGLGTIRIVMRFRSTTSLLTCSASLLELPTIANSPVPVPVFRGRVFHPHRSAWLYLCQVNSLGNSPTCAVIRHGVRNRTQYGKFGRRMTDIACRVPSGDRSIGVSVQDSEQRCESKQRIGPRGHKIRMGFGCRVLAEGVNDVGVVNACFARVPCDDWRRGQWPVSVGETR
jgi:hypothetical protein